MKNKIKLIIAGGRKLNVDVAGIKEYIEKFNIPELECVVSGRATGIDTCGEYFARYYLIPIKQFRANWTLYGKRAGPLRNKEMGQYADALLLIWDRKSKGSKNMKEFMLAAGKPIYEVIRNKK